MIKKLLINVVVCVGGAFVGQNFFVDAWSIWLSGGITAILSMLIWEI